jgi:uncharacterized protein
LIAIDTNILVYAHRSDSPFHEAATNCVREAAEGRAPWALPWPCVHEFLSVVTHPRIYDPPSTIRQAAEQVEAWLDSPSVVPVSEGTLYWPTVSRLMTEGKVAGPVVHDARVAALCISHGVRELWTADRDFSRFPALRTTNPLI